MNTIEINPDFSSIEEKKNYRFGVERKNKMGQIVFDGLIIRFTSIGSEPRLVRAEWAHTNGINGISEGGFQRKKDYDFPTAVKLALSNAKAASSN